MTTDPGGRRARAPALAAVALLGAGYFAIGIRWALGWPRGWIDSGLVVYGSWRTAHGALPYRDFDHVYGPALFYLNGALLRLFGADLAVVAASLVALKAALALLLFALARVVAGVRVAAATTLVLVVVWGAPLWLFGAPYAQHYGLACELAGLLAVAAAGPARRRALALAGLWAGLAATFKLTCGLFALLAFALSALAETAPDARATQVRTARVRALRLAAAAAALATALLYALGTLPTSADAASLATVTVLAAPFAWAAAVVLRGELAPRGDPAADARGVGDVLALAAAAALPPLAWAAFYVARGAGHDLVRDLFALPPRLHWFLPLQPPSALAALVLAAAALAARAMAADRPRLPGALAALAAGAAALIVAGSRPGGTTWVAHVAQHTLGRFAYEVVYALPLLAVAVGMPLARTGGRAPAPDVPRLYFVFAAANLLLLLPAADIWHAFMALPACLPLVAHLLAARTPAGVHGRRALAGALPLLVLAVVAVPFVAQLEGAREAWRGARARFARASGITHPDAKFDDVAALVRHLDAESARARGVFVLTGEAMIYFLAGRVSALEHEEYLMQTLVRGAASPGSSSLLGDDRRFVRRLKATRPLVVDDTSHPARAGLERFFPRVARLLARYRVRETFGSYLVLDR